MYSFKSDVQLASKCNAHSRFRWWVAGLNRQPQNRHRQQKVIRMTTKNRRVSSLDWINSATLSVRIFLCLACCRCKECRFSNAAKSAGVHPSNRFAFLARIPFCRANTDTSSLRSAENNLCRTDSLPTLFLLNAISRLRKRLNI